MPAGLIVDGTPVQTYDCAGRTVLVKREDLSCPPPGPGFSKARGVLAHARTRSEPTLAALDTFHSRAGWAVAAAAAETGKASWTFYPVYKGDAPAAVREPQYRAALLGSLLRPLAAGRSAILYHRARRACPPGVYLFPNALKLPESVAETAAEVARTGADAPTWIVPASSATLAAGVARGLVATGRDRRTLIVHLGYSRPEPAVRRYLESASGGTGRLRIVVVDDGYAYRDRVDDPCPFPSSPYYDRKAWRWLARARFAGPCVFWNIGG